LADVCEGLGRIHVQENRFLSVSELDMVQIMSTGWTPDYSIKVFYQVLENLSQLPTGGSFLLSYLSNGTFRIYKPSTIDTFDLDLHTEYKSSPERSLFPLCLFFLFFFFLFIANPNPNRDLETIPYIPTCWTKKKDEQQIPHTFPIDPNLKRTAEQALEEMKKQQMMEISAEEAKKRKIREEKAKKRTKKRHVGPAVRDLDATPTGNEVMTDFESLLQQYLQQRDKT
jgi:hypothetical protein